MAGLARKCASLQGKLSLDLNREHLFAPHLIDSVTVESDPPYTCNNGMPSVASFSDFSMSAGEDAHSVFEMPSINPTTIDNSSGVSNSMGTGELSDTLRSTQSLPGAAGLSYSHSMPMTRLHTSYTPARQSMDSHANSELLPSTSLPGYTSRVTNEGSEHAMSAPIGIPNVNSSKPGEQMFNGRPSTDGESSPGKDGGKGPRSFMEVIRSPRPPVSQQDLDFYEFNEIMRSW